MGARIAGLGALALAVVIVLGIVFLSGGSDHTLRVAFDSAVQLAPSQDVRVAGRNIGTISSVQEANGQAIVTLSIDGSVWPLRQGTTATARWGSTSGYALRYVELAPGPASAPPLPDNGLLSQGQAVSAVELDQVYRIFRGPSRADLGALVDELGHTFGPQGTALASALHQSPPALGQLGEVLDSLGADEHALGSLVTAGDRLTGTLAAHDGPLGSAVGHLAQTFATFGARAGDIQQSLVRLPTTLRTSASAMNRLDVSITGLQALTDVLGPGAVALQRMAPAARGSLHELRAVAPLAANALNSGTAAAPAIVNLLRAATPFVPRLGDAVGKLAPMAACVRPYGPEIAGALSTWIGFAKGFDAQGHYARILVEAPPTLIGGTQSAAQVVSAHGGQLHYAMPRPPGLNAGKPWFQPQCGAGPDALNPALDPERSGS